MLTPNYLSSNGGAFQVSFRGKAISPRHSVNLSNATDDKSPALPKMALLQQQQDETSEKLIHPKSPAPERAFKPMASSETNMTSFISDTKESKEATEGTLLAALTRKSLLMKIETD